MRTLFLDCSSNAAQMTKCGCKAVVETNGNDVTIAQTVCCSIVTIIAIVVGGFLLWKLMEHIVQNRQSKRQHVWETEEKVRNRNVELLDEKLKVLKDQCYVKKDKGEKQKGVKYGIDKIKRQLAMKIDISALIPYGSEKSSRGLWAVGKIHIKASYAAGIRFNGRNEHCVHNYTYHRRHGAGYDRGNPGEKSYPFLIHGKSLTDLIFVSLTFISHFEAFHKPIILDKHDAR